MQDAEYARLFLALWPDAALRANLADYARSCNWQGRPARVSADKLHLTLHFLGKVARASIPQLSTRLALPSPSFELVLGRPALLGRNIAVIEALGIPAELRLLHESLQKTLLDFGLPVESRPFRPHLTLARRAEQVGFPAEPLKTVWRVEEYLLLESRMETGEYRVLQRYPLTGA